MAAIFIDEWVSSHVTTLVICLIWLFIATFIAARQVSLDNSRLPVQLTPQRPPSPPDTLGNRQFSLASIPGAPPTGAREMILPPPGVIEEIVDNEESGTETSSNSSLWNTASRLTTSVFGGVSSFLGAAYQKGKRAADTALHTPVITFEKYNVNVLQHGANLIVSLTDAVNGKQHLTYREVIRKLTAIRSDLDDQIERASQAVQSHRRGQASTTHGAGGPASSPSPDASSQLLETEQTSSHWAEEEQRMRSQLIQSTVTFLSYRFFNESILGREPENGTLYYNTIINSADPQQTYIQQLDLIGQLIAKILLPIIEWVIGLVFHSKEGKLTGIAKIAEQTQEYFSDPTVLTSTVEDILTSCSEYFYKLHAILEAYNEGEKISSFQEYLLRELDEDLTNNGLSKEALYSNANARFVDMIDIESGIPIIGPLCDKIIKSSLKPILDNANLLQNAIKEGFGSIRPSSEFSYAMMAFINDRLRQWTQTFRDQSSAYNNPLREGLQIASSPPFELNRSQKELLKTLFQRLVRYLPFEGVQNEAISGLLDAEATPHKHQEKILNALEDLFIQVVQIVAYDLSHPDQQRRLWLESLKLMQKFYQLNPSNSLNDVEDIQNDTRACVHEFIDAALEVHFKDEVSKMEYERNIQKILDLTSKAREKIDHAISKLTEIHQSLNQSLEDLDIDQMENSILLLSTEIKELFSKLSKSLTDSFDQAENRPKIEMTANIETGFLTGINESSNEIISINQSSKKLLDHASKLRALKQLKEVSTPLLPDEEIISDDPIDILPGIKLADFQQWKIQADRFIREIHADRPNEFADPISRVSELTSKIHQHNHNQTKREQIKEGLSQIFPARVELDEINQSIAQRPNLALCGEMMETLNSVKAELRLIKASSTNSANLNYDRIGIFLNNLQLQPVFETYRSSGEGMAISGSFQLLLDDFRPLEQFRDRLRQIERDSATPEQRQLLVSSIQRDKLPLILRFENRIADLERHINHLQTLNTTSILHFEHKIVHVKRLLAEISTVTQSLQIHPSIQRAIYEPITLKVDALLLANRQVNGQRTGIEGDLHALEDCVNAALVHQEEGMLQESNAIEEKQQDLRASLTEFLTKVNGGLAFALDEARRINALFETAVSTMNQAKNKIIDPEYTTFYFGLKNFTTGRQKAKVYPELQKLAFKMLELLLNPLHAEQIILRGPLKQLMP